MGYPLKPGHLPPFRMTVVYQTMAEDHARMSVGECHQPSDTHDSAPRYTGLACIPEHVNEFLRHHCLRALMSRSAREERKCTAQTQTVTLNAVWRWVTA